MQVAHHFFENGVAFFTRNLQIGTSFTASSGDGECAPACVKLSSRRPVCRT
jgi:hypothetical protein